MGVDAEKGENRQRRNQEKHFRNPLSLNGLLGKNADRQHQTDDRGDRRFQEERHGVEIAPPPGRQAVAANEDPLGFARKFPLELDAGEIRLKVPPVAQEQHREPDCAEDETAAPRQRFGLEKPEQGKHDAKRDQEHRGILCQNSASPRATPAIMAIDNRFSRSIFQKVINSGEEKCRDDDIGRDEPRMGEDIGAEAVEDDGDDGAGIAVQSEAPREDVPAQKYRHEHHHETRERQQPVSAFAGLERRACPRWISSIAR